MSALEELTKLASTLASEETQGAGVKNPYPCFFINYDPEVSALGQFAMGGEKDDEGNWITPPPL